MKEAIDNDGATRRYVPWIGDGLELEPEPSGEGFDGEPVYARDGRVAWWEVDCSRCGGTTVCQDRLSEVRCSRCASP